jgi:two-component system sensor histidine kinase KdpD
MKRIRWPVSPELISDSLLAVLTVAVTTAILALIGRDTLGEAIIALLYLVPVAWSSARWGLVPGACATLAAILAYDFFFTLPFYSFTVSRMESLLILVVLSVTAVLVVAGIQLGLSRTRTDERDAIFMVGMNEALAGLRTRDAVVHALASHLHQMFQASLVEVFVLFSQSSSLSARVPSDAPARGKPDRMLPILAAPELVGEIRLWRGSGWLPPEDSYLFRNLATQAALALERARLAEVEERMQAATPAARVN